VQAGLTPLTHSDGRTLLSPLGSWTIPGSQLHQQWPAYYNPQYKFLYLLTNNGFLQYELFDTCFCYSALLPAAPVPPAVSHWVRTPPPLALVATVLIAKATLLVAVLIPTPQNGTSNFSNTSTLVNTSHYTLCPSMLPH
jgi:hypothetical protein